MIAEELFQSWWPQEEQFWYRRIQWRAIRPATIALLPTHDVKLSTRILGETLNQHLERNGLLVDERKGCRNGIQGTKDRLLVDKTDLKNCWRRLTNLPIALKDYKKAYATVLHSWILKCLEMVGAAKSMISKFSNSMVNCKTLSGGVELGQVDIRRGIGSI